MKHCDLCKREKHNDDSILCEVCGDMITRLIAVDQRMRTREVSQAERLANAAGAANGAAA